MDNPICFPYYFINKQNVRSINNVFNLKLLKKRTEEDFLFWILQDKSLVSEISSEYKDMLITLRSNVKNNCKQDCSIYFMENEDHKKRSKSIIMPMQKEEIFIHCWRALYATIPKSFFGNQHNTKIFKDVVRVVLFSMKNQHIFLPKFICNWNLETGPWNCFSTIPIEKVYKVLNKTVCWVLKNLLSAIICLNFFVTTCKIDVNENKLHFFRKNLWQSFYDKNISDMIYSKIICRFEPKCFGRKVKAKYSLQEKLQFKIARREIPKLHLVLKPNNNYRPIVRYKNDILNSTMKYKIKDRLNFLRVLTGKPQDRIETKYAAFYSAWITLKQPKLYFVKTDLSNAFGSINKEKLMKILAEKHLEYQKLQHPLYLKKKFAQIYREVVTELRKPFLVRAGSTVYEWKEGLVQGYKYSPALSELYYSHMDEIYFKQHLENHSTQLNLFVRVVDDYLYITNSLEDAHSFLTALSSYRNVNYNKTMVNFSHPTVNYSDDITFLGYTYNTKTLQVNRASSLFTGQMCYKITFSSAISNIARFLENRIGQSGIHVNSHLFNFNFNSEELIWNNIFLTFCLSANKFCTILSILCNVEEMPRYLDIYKKKVTVKLCNAMIEALMQNKPNDFLFVYCINHFRYLSFKALSLCARKSSKCNILMPVINIEVCKTNCIFGKFRDHACKIDRHGKCLFPAVKNVCRRTDLRKIMKQFEVLPNGFECYNHKKFFT